MIKDINLSGAELIIIYYYFVIIIINFECIQYTFLNSLIKKKRYKKRGIGININRKKSEIKILY